MSDNQLIYACDVCIHQEKITNKKKTKKMKKTKMMMMKKIQQSLDRVPVF